MTVGQKVLKLVMDIKPVVMRSDGPTSSPFSKSAFNFKTIGIVLVVILVLAGVGVGVYLTRDHLQFNPKADTPPPAGGPAPINSVAPLELTPEPSANRANSQQSSSPAVTENPATAAAQVSEISYDFNNDGKVNSIDLSFIYASWGTPKPGQEKADLNKDGVVNGVDYSLFLPNFKI